MADSPADLQFERAERSGEALPKDVRCVACRTPLSSYFEVNGNVFVDWGVLDLRHELEPLLTKILGDAPK